MIPKATLCASPNSSELLEYKLLASHSLELGWSVANLYILQCWYRKLAELLNEWKSKSLNIKILYARDLLGRTRASHEQQGRTPMVCSIKMIYNTYKKTTSIKTSWLNKQKTSKKCDLGKQTIILQCSEKLRRIYCQVYSCSSTFAKSLLRCMHHTVAPEGNSPYFSLMEPLISWLHLYMCARDQSGRWERSKTTIRKTAKKESFHSINQPGLHAKLYMFLASPIHSTKRDQICLCLFHNDPKWVKV